MRAKAAKTSSIVVLVVVLGVLLRLMLFAANRPDDAYDDHWTPIETVLKGGPAIPRVETCWECGQPPLFTLIGTQVYRITRSWVDPGPELYSMRMLKVLQGLAFLFGALTVVLFARVATRLSLGAVGKISAVALVALLPRHIYLSAMLANDTLAVLIVTLALYVLLRSPLGRCPTLHRVGALGLLTGLAAFSKGTALVLAPAVGTWILWWAFRERRPLLFMQQVVVFGLAFVVAGGWIYLWRWIEYGDPFIKNMEFFGLEQEPGYMGLVSFLPRPISLMRIPFLDQVTATSLPTQVYARLWFDYEMWVAGNANRAEAVVWARGMYILGLVPTALMLWGFVVMAGRAVREPRYLVFCLLLLLSLVLVVSHSMHYRVYSSMKATYMLPGIAALGLAFGLGIERAMALRSRGVRLGIVVACVLCGLGIVGQMIWVVASGPGHPGL